MELNIKNTFNCLDFVIQSSTVFLFIRLVPHWSAVLISQKSFNLKSYIISKKVEKTNPSH